MLTPRIDLERKRERERQLAYAAWQQRKSHEFGYFMKYDELTGVLACPGVKLRPLNISAFNPNYRNEMNERVYDDCLEEIDMKFE